MHMNFEVVSTLQYRNRSLTKQVEELKSGEQYVRMEEENKRLVRFHNREMKRMEYELSKAHSETVTVRRYWGEVMDDLDKEHKAEIRRLLSENERLKRQNLELARQRDTTKDKLRECLKKYYALAVRHKKITNSREKTGRRPGGQPGHKGHCRKKQVLTREPILLVPPQEVQHDPDFKKTAKTIVKQLVNIRFTLDVAEYRADIYYNSKTGERRHAAFPDGVVDDVNYGGSIKAFLFLLNHDCCTSIDKSRKFLSDLTDGWEAEHIQGYGK